MFQESSGVWGKMATVAGADPSFAACGVPAPIQILSQEVLDKIPSFAAPAEHPFRLEMLGDLIVDCGHNPLHPEIHPPVAIYMHLGGSTGRYSLFGWRRMASEGEDPSDNLFVDLWPAVPKPNAASQLNMNVLYNDGVETNSEAAGVWICVKYPFGQTPDRYRCFLTPLSRFSNGGGGSDRDRCDDNPRFLPSCQDGVAGGLVEVSWQ